MNEYDSIINDYVEAPASQAAISINDNPDRAVRRGSLVGDKSASGGFITIWIMPSKNIGPR